MSVEFERPVQPAVVAYMLEHVPVEPKARTYSFQLDEPDRLYYAASARMRDVKEISLVFTTGLYGDMVFFTLTDGDPHDIAELLVRLEEFNARKPMAIGDTYRPVGLGLEYLSKNGWSALLLLPASTPDVTSGFPDRVTLRGECRRLALVALLNQEEYAVKREKGLNALLDHFTYRKKDLIASRA